MGDKLIKKNNRDKVIIIKLTENDKKIITENANKYADGNVSLWLRHAGKKYIPTKVHEVEND